MKDLIEKEVNRIRDSLEMQESTKIATTANHHTDFLLKARDTIRSAQELHAELTKIFERYYRLKEEYELNGSRMTPEVRSSHKRLMATELARVKIIKVELTELGYIMEEYALAIGNIFAPTTIDEA